MKYQVLSLMTAALLSMNAFAGETSPSVGKENKSAVLKAINNEAMLKAALREARKSGETCEIKVNETKGSKETGLEFKASIHCGVPADEYIGGGIVRMIDIEGRIFGEWLENFSLTVQRAG